MKYFHQIQGATTVEDTQSPHDATPNDGWSTNRKDSLKLAFERLTFHQVSDTPPLRLSPKSPKTTSYQPISAATNHSPSNKFHKMMQTIFAYYIWLNKKWTSRISAHWGRCMLQSSIQPMYARLLNNNLPSLAKRVQVDPIDDHITKLIFCYRIQALEDSVYELRTKVMSTWAFYFSLWSRSAWSPIDWGMVTPEHHLDCAIDSLSSDCLPPARVLVTYVWSPWFLISDIYCPELLDSSVQINLWMIIRSCVHVV